MVNAGDKLRHSSLKSNPRQVANSAAEIDLEIGGCAAPSNGSILYA